MYRSNLNRRILVSAFVLLFVLMRLEVIIQPASVGTAIEDELNLSLGGIDRQIGAPFTNTHWPGMISPGWAMVRVRGIEPRFQAWEAHVIAVILHPRERGLFLGNRAMGSSSAISAHGGV